MPTVVSSPPRVATAQPTLSSTSGSQPKFGYSIPVSLQATSFRELFLILGTGELGHHAVDYLGFRDDKSGFVVGVRELAAAPLLGDAIVGPHEAALWGWVLA